MQSAAQMHGPLLNLEIEARLPGISEGLKLCQWDRVDLLQILQYVAMHYNTLQNLYSAQVREYCVAMMYPERKRTSLHGRH